MEGELSSRVEEVSLLVEEEGPSFVPVDAWGNSLRCGCGGI